MRKINIGKVNIIGMILILCISFCDIVMCFIGANPCRNGKVVYESHELDYAGADGYFGGNDSDSPVDGSGVSQIEEHKDVHMFNILEIVPFEGMGVIGYTIADCEPVGARGLKSGDDIIATKSEMIAAYMDALVNKVPGSNEGNKDALVMNDDVGMLSSKSAEGAGQESFKIVYGNTYNGYYKYVGENRGVYAIGKGQNGSKEIDKSNNTAIMVSKFYPNSHNHFDDFGYIWVYGEESQPNATPDDLSKIYVNNHAKVKYINNEKFLKDSMGLAEGEIGGWRANNSISVRTKAPKDVDFDDIEWADLIVINSGNNMDYYQNALNIYNKINNTNYNRGNFSFSTVNDFKSFEHVIRIYERVVIREDVAIVASRNCVNGNVFDTNLRKLMCMLFYVNHGSERYGSGRTIFMDFMKRYVDEPGTHTTFNPKTGTSVSYYELRNMDGGEKFKAPSLRNGFMSDGTFMHKTHPLVKFSADSITGWHYDENNNIVPDKGKPDPNKNYENRRTAKRNDTDMYRRDGNVLGLDSNASHEQMKAYKEKEGEFYYLPYDENYGVTKQQWSASEREKQELNQYKEDYSPYRWRMPLYESKSNTTDYVYIDDDGRFIRDTKYSGKWYGLDALTNNGDVWEYKIVEWSSINENTWPWNVVEGGCLKEWWFGDGSTQVPGNSNGKHIHLYYDYYAYDSYRALTTAEAGTYKNQSLEQENDLFKGSLIEDALDAREIKREETDEHVVNSDDHTVKKDVPYYLSVNIVNGDGVGLASEGIRNKVLYINEYEVNDTVYIPLQFRVSTSEDIVKIELYRKGGSTPLASYTPVAGSNIQSTDNSVPLNFTGSGSGLELERITQYDDSGKPSFTIAAGEDYKYVYKFECTESNPMKDLLNANYATGVNNTFELRVTINPTGTSDSTKWPTVSDYITIVRRDFYDLD